MDEERMPPSLSEGGKLDEKTVEWTLVDPEHGMSALPRFHLRSKTCRDGWLPAPLAVFGLRTKLSWGQVGCSGGG